MEEVFEVSAGEREECVGVGVWMARNECGCYVIEMYSDGQESWHKIS